MHVREPKKTYNQQIYLCQALNFRNSYSQEYPSQVTPISILWNKWFTEYTIGNVVSEKYPTTENKYFAYNLESFPAKFDSNFSVKNKANLKVFSYNCMTPADGCWG